MDILGQLIFDMSTQEVKPTIKRTVYPGIVDEINIY